MKKFHFSTLSSVLAVILALVFLSAPIVHGADIEPTTTLTSSEPYPETKTWLEPSVVSQNLLDDVWDGLFNGTLSFAIDKTLLNPNLVKMNNPANIVGQEDVQVDVPQFTVPLVRFITSKLNVLFYDYDGVQQTAFCYMVAPIYENYIGSELEFVEYDGRYYAINCLNFDISVNGELSHYAVRREGFNYTGISSISQRNDYWQFNLGTWQNVYKFKWDGSGVETVLEHTNRFQTYNFYFSTVNSSNFDMWEDSNSHAGGLLERSTMLFQQFDSTVEKTTPDPLSFVVGNIGATYWNDGTQKTYYYNCIFKSKWIIEYSVDNKSSGVSGNNRQYTTNVHYTAGTTINYNNYNDYYNSAYSPIFNEIKQSNDFDLNTLLTDLLPDIKANLQPTLELDNNSLKANIDNLLQHMPDIGFNWGTGDNNYIDLWNNLNPPIIVTTSEAGGGCNWITPTYSAYDDSTNIVATYPTLPTNTLPQNFIDNAKDLFQGGYDFMNALGLIAVIIPVALFGILWKFTGG